MEWLPFVSLGLLAIGSFALLAILLTALARELFKKEPTDDTD